MFAALVVMGAAACTEGNESVDGGNNGGGNGSVSFEVAVANADAEAAKAWADVFLGNDTINIVYDNTTYAFTNSEDDKLRFTCTTEGVSKIVGKSVKLSLNTTDKELSTKGLSGIYVDMDIEKFDPTKRVELEVKNSFLRYTIESEAKVTLELNYPAFIYNSGKNSSISFTNITGECYVSFLPGDKTEAALKVSVDGTLGLETTLQLSAGKIYDLGTLVKPENGGDDGKDDPTTEASVYFSPGVWNVDGAWFAAYFFNAAGDNNAVTLTAENDFYTCAVPAGMESVIFCRMNPAYTEFGWNDDTTTDRLWNQTADLTIGVDPNNVYYIHDWEVGMWGTKDGYDAPAPVAPWSVAGTFNEWGSLPMDFTETDNMFVASNVTLAEGDMFKITGEGKWYGAAVTIEADRYVSLTAEDGEQNNIKVAAAGSYDIYLVLDSESPILYFMTAGTDITAATEQLPNGGGTTSTSWAVAGTFTSWADLAMEDVAGSTLVVAKELTLTSSDMFKVKNGDTWYGGSVSKLEANKWTAAVMPGSDIAIATDGTYDIYFDYAQNIIYLMTTGTAIDTATEQTIEMSDTVVYLKPNSNWMADGARFAAYFWNNGGSIWVSMTDSNADGIYEVFLPAGYAAGCNIIFCRMNPANETNSWDNKWNQTEDLTVPTDGRNLYTVADGTWDNGGGTWSTL